MITDPKQKRKFREYQAARGFRRRRGKEALLYQKSKQRRIQATADYQGRRNVPLMLQCCHKSCEGEQCGKFSLPLAKFCKDRILLRFMVYIRIDCQNMNVVIMKCNSIRSSKPRSSSTRFISDALFQMAKIFSFSVSLIFFCSMLVNCILGIFL